MTPLLVAARVGNVDIVNLLLDNGAIADLADKVRKKSLPRNV